VATRSRKVSGPQGRWGLKKDPSVDPLERERGTGCGRMQKVLREKRAGKCVISLPIVAGGGGEEKKNKWTPTLRSLAIDIEDGHQRGSQTKGEARQSHLHRHLVKNRPIRHKQGIVSELKKAVNKRVRDELPLAGGPQIQQRLTKGVAQRRGERPAERGKSRESRSLEKKGKGKKNLDPKGRAVKPSRENS